jgi:hypothetical protein
MINILDIIIGGLILYYLLRNAGGLSKTIKNFLVVIFFLIILAIISRLVLGWEFAKPAHEYLEGSYLVKVSHVVVKWLYPAVENTAPKIDSFMKEKVLSAPTPEVEAPKVDKIMQQMPAITLPTLTLPKSSKN